jgi:hypothetical protein
MSLPADALAPFSTLPDGARLWLMALDRSTEAGLLAPELDALLAKWRHKGMQYHAAWALLEGRILAIAEPTLAEQPSGCAIDGMLRGVHRLAEAAGLGLADPQDVAVRVGAGIRVLPRTDLKARLSDGTLDAATPVLDLALYTLGDLRQGRLEKPLAATWIGRKYKVQAPAGTGA